MFEFVFNLALCMCCYSKAIQAPLNTPPEDEGIIVYGAFDINSDGTKSLYAIDSIWVKGKQSKCKKTPFYNVDCVERIECFADYNTLKFYANCIRPSFNDTILVTNDIQPLAGVSTMYYGQKAILEDLSFSDSSVIDKAYYLANPKLNYPLAMNTGFLLYSIFYHKESMSINGDGAGASREVVLLSLKYCPVSDKDIAFKPGSLHCLSAHCPKECPW